MKEALYNEKLDVSRIEKLVHQQRDHKPAMLRLSAKERIERVKRIKNAMFDYREEIHDAMYRDLKKPAVEVDMTEIYVVVNEAKDAIKNIKHWMRPSRVPTPINMLGTTGKIMYEPKGNTLIISPWNFPVNLVFGPLISAIAAGNTAIIKPSEYTPHTSALIEVIIKNIFHENEVAIVNGSIETSTELLKHRFDHIFFTGSPKVGKIVMRAASDHLASVTLELGGKSPSIIDDSANINLAVKKIVAGKFTNCGQACISHDYIFVHKKNKDALIDALKKRIIKVFGEDASKSESYARIVNKANAERIAALVNGVKENILFGGEYSLDDNYISPTIIVNPDLETGIMEEEIFGPILPIIEYEDLNEVIKYVNSKEKPLALYVFSKKSSTINRVRELTSSGSLNINETAIHYYNTELPFGGINNSGIGKAHGFFGFKSFSNEKGILKQHLPFSAIDLITPPYTKASKFWADIFLKYF